MSRAAWFWFCVFVVFPLILFIRYRISLGWGWNNMVDGPTLLVFVVINLLVAFIGGETNNIKVLRFSLFYWLGQLLTLIFDGLVWFNKKLNNGQ